jgi:hypothetical protein
MNIEERLSTALHQLDVVDPSPDLWDRVVHSIEEDRTHRRRVIGTALAVAATLIAVVGVGALAAKENRWGTFIDRPTLEVLEVVVLCALTLMLGPAIRRFGRGFAADLWPQGSAIPPSILRLLDFAYYLVLAGYILISTEFEFGNHFLSVSIGEQLGHSAIRIGGLLLLVGLLHATTIAALPVVALIDNSTRVSKPLPRWVIVISVIAVLQVAPLLPMLVVIGLSG